MYKCAKHLSTMTFPMMKANIKEKLGVDLSCGTIRSLKPFFCVVPTDREKTLCMCKTCLNIRNCFNAVVQCLKGQAGPGDDSYPTSITEHFLDGCHCDNKDDNGYYNM